AVRTAHHKGTGAFHRRQGLDHAGWRVADGEYGRGCHLFGADHSAYTQCHHLGRLARWQRGQYRGRPDGPLRGAAGGNEVAAATIVSCAGLTRASILLTRWLPGGMDCRVKPGNDDEGK